METITMDILLNSTNLDKKEIQSKFGYTEKKIGDLKKHLESDAYKLHLQNKDFTNTDIIVFERYWNTPCTSTKLQEAFSNESPEFIKYFTDYVEKRAAKQKYNWLIRRINTIYKVLGDIKKKENFQLQEIYEELERQTEEFKKQYIQNIWDFELRRFNEFKQYKGYSGYVRYNGTICWKNSENEILEDAPSKRWFTAFMKMKTASNDFDQKIYEERVKADAYMAYKSNLMAVAERLDKLNQKTFSVSYIGNDPKAFEMVFDAGLLKLHCRSIFCAEYSVLVTPHWRFIMTAI